MIKDLTTVGVEDLRAVIASVTADPDLPVSLQCLSDLFCTVPVDVLAVLNDLFVAAPHLELRLFSAMDHSAPIDLEALRAVPNVRHLKLHYGVPGLIDAAPLAALTGLQSAELEIRSAYPLEQILNGWPALNTLSLIREGKASKAVDLSGIARLSDLKDLYVMGYATGIEALALCGEISSLKLQSLTLPSWNVLPPQRLDLLRLNAVKGPEPVPFAEFHQRADRVELVRMDKTFPFERKRAVSNVTAAGFFLIDIDYLNGFQDPEWSGHDWSEALALNCPPPNGVSFDPEAGSLSVAGERGELGSYQLRLLAVIAAILSS